MAFEWLDLCENDRRIDEIMKKLKCWFGCHDWVEVSKEFNPPANKIGKFRAECFAGEAADTFNRDKMGYTNIKQKCVNCSKVEVITCYGKV